MAENSTQQDRYGSSRIIEMPALEARPRTFSRGETYLLRIQNLHGTGSRWETVIFLAYSADPGLSVVDRGGRREVVSRRDLFGAVPGSSD